MQPIYVRKVNLKYFNKTNILGLKCKIILFLLILSLEEKDIFVILVTGLEQQKQPYLGSGQGFCE